MFFDRPESGELAILVHMDLHSEHEPDDPREFEELVLSAGGDPVEFVTGHRSAPNAKYFVGTGKLQELCEAVERHCAELVIFNHNLTPSQERNLEKELKCRVLDRTGLILDIFAQRARTYEGKLQVELAQLQHMATRLVRGWTHLERQKGGIGLRGPGETQLETDRRLLRGRIKSIQKRLEKVRGQREQGRRSRTRAELPTLSLVGYTNAGKSTLFNRLTHADVLAVDQLFATLEEAASASLLLHVVDAPSEERQRNMASVAEVLRDIGAGENPQLLVYNKIDLLSGSEAHIDRDDQGVPVAVWVSAATGAGLDLLIQAIRERLGSDMVSGRYYLAPHLARLRARFYEVGAIQDDRPTEDGGAIVRLSLPAADFNRLLKSESLNARDLPPLADAPSLAESA